MGLAKAVDGAEYQVDSLILQTDGFVATHKPFTEQRIVTANRLEKGSRWRGSEWLLKNFLGDLPDWTLDSVEHLDKNHKRIHFQPIMEQKAVVKKDVDVNPEEFSQLVRELGLTDERLGKLLRDMLLHLFLPKTLKKIEASDGVEFIMDKDWMYLRVDKKAYRV